ncbi:hypothetical protein Tco_0442970, partial [Tanacetum coccineum]
RADSGGLDFFQKRHLKRKMECPEKTGNAQNVEMSISPSTQLQNQPRVPVSFKVQLLPSPSVRSFFCFRRKLRLSVASGA